MDNNNLTGTGQTTSDPAAGTAPNPVSTSPASTPTSAQPDPLATQPAAASGPATPTPATPSVTSNVPQPGTKPAGGGNKIMLIVIGLVLLVLIFAGIYWFMSRQTPTPQTQSQTTNTAPMPAADTIEAELNAITVEDLDAEFTSVDQDLQTL